MLRFISKQSNTITGAAIILGAASLLSRLLGLFRDRVLTHTFGAGDILDSYYAAFRIPDLLFNLLILGALSAGFIPVFTRVFLEDNDGPKRGWELTNKLISVFVVALGALAVALALAAPVAMRLLTPGFDDAKMQMTVAFSRIMMLAPILLGLSGIVGGVLQALKRFLIFSLAPIFYNLGIIFGALIFVPLLGPTGLAWGVVLGAALHLAVQLPTLGGIGFRLCWLFDWRDKLVKKIMTLMVPRTLALATSQIFLLVITVIGSKLSRGTIAVFNLANNLQSVPLGIIAVSYAVAAFPSLTEAAARRDIPALKKTLVGTIRQILLFMIPLSILLILLRAQIVRVIYGSGAFDWTATIATANALAFFAMSLFAQGMVQIVARAFYALEDTRTPFFASLIANGLGALAAIYLARWGVIGLAGAYSIAQILNFVLLWAPLRLKIGTLETMALLHSLFKMSGAAVVMAVVAQIVKTRLGNVLNLDTFAGIFTQGVVAGIVGLAVYVIAGLLLKSEEIKVLVDAVRSRLVRKQFVPTDVSDVGTPQ
ncbi:MAG: putative lipid II flippase MurJ [Candidatus Magasanikbacteria bacterium]|nr:putative lipid II flippase MurJ [Candidatus Magasanikbacteria bacterium]